MAMEVVTPPAPANPRVPVTRRVQGSKVRVIGALVGATVLVVVASQWGEALLADGVRMKIHTPPLRGPIDWRPGRTVLPAIGIGVATLGVLPAIAARARWRVVLAAVGLLAVGWALALALVDGSAAITEPFRHPSQYIATMPRIGDLGEFLRTFTDRLATYNVHTQGHPPGMVVVLFALDAVGLGGATANAVLAFGGGGVAAVAALVAFREVSGEESARRAAPFLVLVPAAIWWSSGDAFFAGVAGVAVMLGVLATGSSGRTSDRLAVGCGIAFGFTALLSYGLVLLGTIPLAVAYVRRRPRPLVVAAAAAGLVLAVVAAVTGFAWWSGLAATRVRYFAGVGAVRPYGYFLVADLAAFALMIGPAGVAGLVRRSPTRAGAALVAGAVGAVLLADVSGMSKAEVERIWIPFVPWVLVAAANGFHRWSTTRAWLAAQVLVTLLIAVGIRSPW